MNRLAKTLILAILLLVIPLKHWGQEPRITDNKNSIEFHITDISVFDERVFFLYNLVNDSRFDVITGEEDGSFIIKANEAFYGLNLQQAFSEFRNENAIQFASMDKVQASETAMEYKAQLPDEYILSLMMDVFTRSRQNNTCANAEPFCTDNGMYVFPAGVNAGSGQTGPDYDCLYSTPNPAWYYMRILNPGGMTIHMFSTPSEDIDFCCWGPFSSITNPSPCSSLTSDKVVSCSYSINATENCIIPSTAQTGDYFILIITNYSNDPCNISFSKTGGTGTTDCGIMPPMVENDGPYCVGETIHLTANGQSGASYSWSGPGNFTSAQQNPTRANCTMTMQGTYTCTITVGSATNSATTEVVVYPQPTANFTATSVCQGNATQFTNTSTTNPSGQQISSYQWNFGDGQTSTEQNPSHTYANAGTYPVTLTVSCGEGLCTDTKTQNVIVYAEPAANAGPDQTIPLNNYAQLSGSGGAGTFNFHWEPASMVTNPNAQNTQTVTLTQDQTYTLTVTNPQGGCSSTDEVTIHIEGSALTATANAAPSSICQGGSTQLTANAGGGLGSSTYSWSPTTGLSNPNIYNPIASPTQTTTYTCTVHNAQTSQTATASVTVTVNSALEGDYYTTICENELPFTFHNVVFNAAGEQTITLPNATPQGCDSIVTLHVGFYPSYTESETTPIVVEICDGESYTFHAQGHNDTYTESISTTYTLETIHGCDSIVRLNLTKWDPNPIISDPRDICVGQTLTWIDGNEYDQDGTVVYYDSIDSHGCPQVYKLELTVGEFQTPLGYNPNVYRCVPHDATAHYHWDIANRDYYDNAIDSVIISDPTGGCDFKYRLNLKFHQNFYSVEEPVVTCDEYIWPLTGESFTEAGQHTYERKPATYHFGDQECDSTYILDITINKQSILDPETIREECDSVPIIPWPGHETVYFYENTAPAGYTFIGETEEGCHLEKTYHIENMHYSPLPNKIKCSDAAAVVYSSPNADADTAAVVTNTEFFSFQYTFFIKETNSKCVWDSCIWTISKPSWTIEFDPIPKRGSDGKYYSECTVYVADRQNEHVILTATPKNGCSSDERKFYLKSSFLDIDEYNSIPAEVNIVPNPNNGQMHIDFENLEGRTSVKVFDMTGNQIDAFETTINSNRYNYEYNMKRYADGIYFFVVSNNNRVLTKKVIVIH